jgi:hypothetical protein
MTHDKAQAALDRARRDYAHATRALFDAPSDAARRRHARRCQVAARRIEEAAGDVRRLAWTLENERRDAA